MSRSLSVLVLACAVLSAAPSQAGVHTTYLWHLEQPIYWPGPNASGERYETAWDSIMAKNAGAVHPQNDLDEIFGKDDRVAVYQWRVRSALEQISGQPDAGAQVSYSGGLIENIASLGAAGQLGYSGGWADGFREARGWTTSGGHPRLDVVQFPFHHALLPLVDLEVVRMELLLYQEVYGEAWGPVAQSRGLFPSEMAFAEHIIPVLVDAGIDWVIVSNSHISRACPDYPWTTHGENIPPANRADQLNPAQGYYNKIQIDRGVAPSNAVPFAYRPHWARFVDPDTGRESRIIVVPAAQAESWQDGYQCFGTGAVDALSAHDDGGRPMLLLLAHDGDNAFGGGFSYYEECTPNFVGAAVGAGHHPTTVQQYLADHPVPADSLVHVESGAWVNADGDFGAPTFWNWNWPLVDSAGDVDIANGWAEDERNWAVITAATNEVLTATAVAGEPSLAAILHPENGANDIERAWHYLLGALNSGYMYYGMALDMELKPSVACNEAVRYADSARGGQDPIGPTVWLPQRWPDNPGGLNYGALYHWQEVQGPSDFTVWTFVHDVSGVREVSVKVRVDADGANPMDDDANETYAGGPGVGDWQTVAMTGRAMPKGNVTDNPEFDDSIQPDEIADVYYATVEGYSEVLLDYYVEAVDTNGHVTRSPIQHVWVGEVTTGGGPGDPDGVHWEPAHPTKDQPVTIFTPDPGKLHWGVAFSDSDHWQGPPESLWPAGTALFQDGPAVQTPLAGPDADGFYAVTIGPFTGSGVETIDFVIARADGSWDNNGGADYHVTLHDDPLPPVDAGGTGGEDAGSTGGEDAGRDSGSTGGEDTGSTGGDDTGSAGGDDSSAIAGPDGQSQPSDVHGGWEPGTDVDGFPGGGIGCTAASQCAATSWLLVLFLALGCLWIRRRLRREQR